MDPTAILTLAGIVITTFGPFLVRIAEAAIAGKDPVTVLSTELVGEILPESSLLDDAERVAHAHAAAMALKEADLGDLDLRQLAVAESAIALHNLVLVGTA